MKISEGISYRGKVERRSTVRKTLNTPRLSVQHTHVLFMLSVCLIFWKPINFTKTVLNFALLDINEATPHASLNTQLIHMLCCPKFCYTRETVGFPAHSAWTRKWFSWRAIIPKAKQLQKWGAVPLPFQSNCVSFVLGPKYKSSSQMELSGYVCVPVRSAPCMPCPKCWHVS